MTYFYTPIQKTGYKVFIICILSLFFITFKLSAQELLTATIEKECENCFSSELIDFTKNGDCVHIDLMVYTTGPCNASLSHLMVEVPCGRVSEILNSENWPVESIISDPTTGLAGIKFDDINNFGDGGKPDTVFVSYTVCSYDSLCLEEIEEDIKLAYKAGTCVFPDEIPDGIPGDTTGGTPGDTELGLSLLPKNVICLDGSDGAIYSEVNGGVEPYSYLWNNGNSDPELLNIPAGTYSLTVTDAAGNTIEGTAEVKQPDSPVSITGEIIPASCTASDGNINVTMSGGTAPYTFSWSNGDTIQNLTAIPKGNYSLSVTDALGCTSSKAFTIGENSDLSLVLTPNYLECYQEGEGEITSEVSGGTEPYSYSWSNYGTGPEISGLHSGLYNLTVTDAQGCTETQSAFIGIRDLVISASIKNPACFEGQDGEISIANVIYGTDPFTYLWGTGDTTATISGLSSGRYEVTVTDSMGCSTTKTLSVTEPRELSFSYSVSPRDCNENSVAEVILSGSGGSGIYEYYLADSLIDPTIVLPGNGDYEIYMRDIKDCETTQTIHIESSTDLSIVSSILQPSCMGLKAGYASFTVNGGAAPYIYTWPDGSGGSTKMDLEPGDYTVDATDANGCQVSSSFSIDSINDVIVQLEDPQQPECNSDNNILNATATNATGFSWDITGADENWSATGSDLNQLIYHAGTGSATAFYHAWNEDGCEDKDSLVLVCTSGGVTDPPADTTGNGEDDDGNGDGDGDGDNDSDVKGDCWSMCWDTEITGITPMDRGCYHMDIQVRVEGFCEHDLSHLIIGLDDAWISKVSNTANYKIEANSTDPKSGVTGLKIDDINGFSTNGLTEFAIAFDVCFTGQTGEGQLPDVIPVIFKAGTCIYPEEMEVYNISGESGTIAATAYPNPFLDEISVKLNSTEDTEVSISVFDLRGNKIADLYQGKLKAAVDYTFPFTAGKYSNDRIFIYKIVSPDQVIRGQILRQK